MEYQHGDFLSAWAAEVSKRLAQIVMENLLVAGESGEKFPQMAERMRAKLDIALIAEGQKLMRNAKERADRAMMQDARPITGKGTRELLGLPAPLKNRRQAIFKTVKKHGMSELSDRMLEELIQPGLNDEPTSDDLDDIAESVRLARIAGQ